MYQYRPTSAHLDFNSDRSGLVVAFIMRVCTYDGGCNPPGARTALHLRPPQPCLIAVICMLPSGCKAYAQLPEDFEVVTQASSRALTKCQLGAYAATSPGRSQRGHETSAKSSGEHLSVPHAFHEHHAEAALPACRLQRRGGAGAGRMARQMSTCRRPTSGCGMPTPPARL